jgi:NitT/TauT family transport system permease protein
MALAIERGNKVAIINGVVAMCSIIIFVDFLIWRPVMAWVRKFQMEEIQDDIADLPFMTTLLRESWLMRRVKVLLKRRVRRRSVTIPAPGTATGIPPSGTLSLAVIRDRMSRSRDWSLRVLAKLSTPLMFIAGAYGLIQLWELVRTLTPMNWKTIWWGVGLTLIRVAGAVTLGSLWAIPVGIWIGLSPRLTRIMQPIIQVIASFPAPMLYPIVLTLMFKFGIAIRWGSLALMMLGVQWYILFNVLAGAMGMPRELKDNMKLLGVKTRTKWMSLYLPAVFPSLVTGWVTAAGGAWNASIVAEYLSYGGEILVAPGIGSMISRATAEANYSMLAGCLTAMVITVVGLNRSLWRWLGELADSRFRFER